MTSAIATEEMLSSSPPPPEPVVSFSEIQVAAPLLAANASGRIRPLMVNLGECTDQNSYRQPAFMKPSKRGPITKPYYRDGKLMVRRGPACSYACILCKAKLFSHKKALIHHQLQSHNNPKELDTLMRASKIGTTFCCPFCEEFSHDLLAGLRRHVQRAHLPGVKFFKLNKSAVVLDSSKSLRVQAISETWGQYPCQFCPFRFPKPADLLQHLDNFHADSVPRLSPPAVTTSHCWPCPTCERPYNNRKSLSMHLTRAHSGDNAVDEKIKWQNGLGMGYKCPYCPGMYSDKLKNVCDHIEAKHRDRKPEQMSEDGVVQVDVESSYKCEQCNKWFRWPAVLLEHIEKRHNTSVKLEGGDSLSLEQLNKLC